MRSMIEQFEELKGIKVIRTEFLCVKWNYDDTILVASCSNGLIRAYSAPSFELLKVLSHRSASLMPVTSLSWYPGEEVHKDLLLANTSDGWVMLFQVTMGILVRSMQLPGHSATVSEFSPDGSLFAVNCKDFSIAIYGTHSFDLKITLDFGQGNKLGHSNKIFSLIWIDNSTLVSGGWDDTVIVWDIHSRSPINYFYGMQLCGQSLDLRKNLLLIGAHGAKQQIQLYNLENSERLHDRTITGEKTKGIVYACQYSKCNTQDYYAVVGSEIGIYNSRTQEQLFNVQLNDRSYCCDWANSEDVIAIGDSGGLIRIFFLNRGNIPYLETNNNLI